MNKNLDQTSGMMINQDMRLYMRLHPKWYLILSRYPQEFPTMIEQYKIENKLTFADRIEKVGTILKMIELLL